MSDQENIGIAKAAIVAYNEKNWNALKGIVTPDFAYEEVATQRSARGFDDVIEIWRGWAAAMPDSVGTFGKTAAAGETVVIELTWRGTHTGVMQTPDGPLPATGRKVELRACQVFELEGAKLKAMRQYFDIATLMNQLGVAHSSGQRTAGA